MEVEISFGGGYDSNAMRFSDNEISEAAQEIGMMGGAKTLIVLSPSGAFLH